jgi:hypothetical protein
MQDPTMIEESSDFYVKSDPHGLLVEAWTAWHLPFMNLTSAQRRYRACLRNAIKHLGVAGGVRATYTSDKVTRNLDTENVLFYNVGAAPFRNVATRILRFDRIHASPPPSPRPLAFEPRHYVRYQGETRDNTFQYVDGAKLAYCLPVVLRGIGEIRDKTKLSRLWWLFKRAVVKAPGAAWSLDDPFAVQLHISAPAKCRLNLADIVKPLMDGFISALHHYEGGQLDDVADRIATLLKNPVQDVRSLLLDDRNALLGPRAVPHLYGDGLQWSPADHLLIAGEVLRDISADDQSVEIHGCFFNPMTRDVLTTMPHQAAI